MGTLDILGSTGRNFLNLMGTDAHVARVLELNFLGVELAWVRGIAGWGFGGSHLFVVGEIKGQPIPL